MSRWHAQLGTFRQLQILLALYDNGSISRAAEQLHLTQPTVSMQLKKLSDAIGAPLYLLLGKKIQFTDAGRRVVQTARKVANEFEQLDSALAALQGLKAGVLRLSVVTTAKYFVPHLLGPFCERYPGVDVALNVGNRQQIIQRLEDGRDDFYVFSHVPQGMALERMAFLENPLVAFAHSGNPLLKKGVLSLDDLAQAPFLMREPGSGTRHAIEQFLQQHQLQLNIKMTVESNEAIRHLVMAGLGVSILSAHTLNLGGVEGLAPLPVQGLPIPTHWHFVWPAAKPLSVIGAAFHQFMAEEGGEVLADFLRASQAFVGAGSR